MSSEFQICAIAQVGDSELYINSLVKGLRKSIRTEVGRKQSLQTRLSPFRSDLSPLRPECPKQKSETFTSLRRRDLKRVISDRLTRKRSSYAGKATLKGAMLLVSYCRPTGKHAREKSGSQVASRHRYTNSIPNVAAVLPDIGGDLERPAPNIMESWDVRCCNQGRGNAELIHGDRGASALPGVIPFPRLATPPAQESCKDAGSVSSLCTWCTQGLPCGNKCDEHLWLQRATRTRTTVGIDVTKRPWESCSELPHGGAADSDQSSRCHHVGA